MSFWETVLSTGIAMVAATLITLGITWWRERRNSIKSEQLFVFKTLMATRANPADDRHISALNTIDFVFYKNVSVRNAWKEYLDHLSHPRPTEDASAAMWDQRKVDLLVDLLAEMGKVLGFAFDRVHIKNQGYYPLKYVFQEQDTQLLRTFLQNQLTSQSQSPHSAKQEDSDAV